LGDDEEEVEEDDQSEESKKSASLEGIAESWLSADEARQICSEAAKTTELHYEQSHAIWNLWRDFEMKVLEVCLIFHMS
jgi:hypothetical protein